MKKAIAEGRARQAGSEPFEEKMARLTTSLREQTGQSAKLDQITCLRPPACCVALSAGRGFGRQVWANLARL